MGSPLEHFENATADHTQRIFIASTSKVSDAPWLKRAISVASDTVREKHAKLELQPWRSAFSPGDITISRLIGLAREVVGAVVILSRDDYVERDGVGVVGPRDNLLIEAGLFLGRLGLSNVLLLREKDSKWPTDFEGVTVKQFTQPNSEETGNIEIVAQDIAMEMDAFVERLMWRSPSAARALRLTSKRLMREGEKLRQILEMEPGEEPLVVPNPGSAYLDAVDEVTSDFCTTTYLKSEFWTSRGIRTVAANEQMLRRVKQSGGRARRIILLPRPLEQELEDQRVSRRSARTRERRKVEKMNQEFQSLSRANTDLMKQGFEVKVIYDREGAYRDLPDQIPFEVGDTELALYDDKRLDVFAGFTSKKKSSVHSYFDGYFTRFQILRQQVERYFNQLWESADAWDFSLFVDQMNALIKEVDREIDYTSNWLALYDNDFGADGDLKKRESGFVVGQLQERYGLAESVVTGHLDLGTCTGRYMNEIAPFVADDGKIVGIDIDQDCIDVLKSKKQKGMLDSRASVSRGDIRKREQLPADAFSVVTCMMGTLCHLERKSKADERYVDDWQTGLENLSALLAPDGDAFIAVWDERACGGSGNEHDLLRIYEEHARSVLCSQTPQPDELEERIAQAGLRPIKSENLDGRLRVFQLRHDATMAQR